MDPRFWRPRTQWTAAVTAALVVVAIVALVLVALDKHGRSDLARAAPVAAVVVGLLSLVVTAATFAASWRRGKKQATIRAWIEWSDSTVETRRLISNLLGPGNLTEAQSRALATAGARVKGKSGQFLSAANKEKAIVAIATMLNGLERIAVGVETGVYDLGTVRKLGGTICVRSVQRCYWYIRARREFVDEPHRQKTVFLSLELLASQLERKSILDRKTEIDKTRIQVLRQG
ncbi:MAG: hypothetical protein QOD07_1188 [Frankiaceae bacterium]|jgi:hypothetical protein|nr:hypothetical protein [Frankiaceae bacterium]